MHGTLADRLRDLKLQDAKAPTTVEQWQQLLQRLSDDYFGFDKQLKVAAEALQSCTLEVKSTNALHLNTARMASLGEMAGAIAHEINNPLAIISGCNQFLKKALATEPLDRGKVNRLTNTIDETINRISAIIRGLRYFSRDADKDDFAETRIKDIIDMSLNLCLEQFKYKGIRLDCDHEKTYLVAECRAVQISQVLLNILNNASDAVEESENKWIKIEVHQVGENIEIAILNGGGKIPEEIITRIMDPFFTTKPVGKGTGLGLSIAKGIMDVHQGRLEVDMKSPHTKFVITLPMRRRQLANPPSDPVAA